MNARISKGLGMLLMLSMATSLLAQQGEPTPAAPLATAEATDLAPAVATPSKATARPFTATIYLIGGSTLTGTLLEATDVSLKTSFGDANIPLSEIAGIKMAQESVATTTVVLHNGDTISGALVLDTLSLQTDWGHAEVNGPSISSMLFVQGVRWISEPGLSGERWKLTELEPPKPPTTPTAAPRTSTPKVGQSPTPQRSR